MNGPSSAERRSGFEALLRSCRCGLSPGTWVKPLPDAKEKVSPRRKHAALPPPLWGRVGEGGSLNGSLCWGTPNPSPQGGGERTVRAVKAGGYLTRVDTIELKPARSVGVAA